METRAEFIGWVTDSIGHGDLEQLLTEIANKFMNVNGDEETIQIDNLVHKDVEIFAELLADYFVGPK